MRLGKFECVVCTISYWQNNHPTKHTFGYATTEVEAWENARGDDLTQRAYYAILTASELNYDYYHAPRTKRMTLFIMLDEKAYKSKSIGIGDLLEVDGAKIAFEQISLNMYDDSAIKSYPKSFLQVNKHGKPYVKRKTTATTITAEIANVRIVEKEYRACAITLKGLDTLWFPVVYDSQDPEERDLYKSSTDKLYKIKNAYYYLDTEEYDLILPIIDEQRVAVLRDADNDIAYKICTPYIRFDALAQKWILCLENLEDLRI